VTADVWEFFLHIVDEKLDGARRRQALAYASQAWDFFEAASVSRVPPANPLLYYYSFLNLAKMALVFQGLQLPVPVLHGIRESARNTKRQRLRFEGQFIRMEPASPNNSRIFPAFVRLFGGAVSSAREYNVRDLLGQIPSIHRTFVRVTGRRSAFVPIKKTQVLHDGKYVWVRFVLDSFDKDVRETLPIVRGRRAFRRVLHRVKPATASGGEIWFETPTVGGRRGAGVDQAMRSLAAMVGTIGIRSLLTVSGEGYRCYFWTGEPREALALLPAVYAVMFYLGSITRYRPYEFETIISGGYSWLVHEFLATQPLQFSYGMASYLARIDVVRPFAVS
jgi:YaaC-like protein